jgi:dTDP-4-amino-4,6-dideoxygalactose transaminase
MKSASTSSSEVSMMATDPAFLFPFLDLKVQFDGIRDEINGAIARVLESQQFVMGPEVSALEKELKRYVGCEYVFGCASGSDALLLSLMALGVGSGDEVITTPFTFVATASSIARLSARPVFVDIDPETYNLDPRHLENAITPRTKAIIPVHLFGLPSEMEAIMDVGRKHDLAVVEDAAQSLGAQYKGKFVGGIGTVGCFSFFPSKNLGGAGDGGLVTTNDPRLAEKLKVLRLHGSMTKYQYELLGMNSRLDALQAAILRVKLLHLDEWTAGRRHNANRYRELFVEYGLNSHVNAPLAPLESVHVYNQFTIRTRQRDALKQYLRDNGIPTEIYYPHPLHLQPAFANLAYKPGSFPESEDASTEVLSLPIFPELTEEQLRIVVRSIAEFSH